MCVCMHTYTDVYPQSCHKYHVPPQVRSHRLYRYTWLLDYNLERYNEESEPCGLIHMLKSMSHCKITQAAWAECEIWLLFIQWKCKNVRQEENIYKLKSYIPFYISLGRKHSPWQHMYRPYRDRLVCDTGLTWSIWDKDWPGGGHVNTV